LKKNIKISLLALLVLSFVFVTACGSKPAATGTTGASASPGAASAPAGKVYTMKLAAATTKDTQQNVMELFKKSVEAKTTALKVELYPAGQLGSNDQMTQMLSSGQIQGIINPTAFMGGFNELMNVVELPYLWPNIQQSVEYLNGEGGKLFEASNAKQNMTILKYYEYGPRTLLMKGKVEKLADFKGKKIRVMGAPVLVDTINTWGGAGVAMGVPEVFAALQNGTIDGIESAANFFYSGKYFENAKYYVDAPSGNLISLFGVNTPWLNSLPADVQKAVKDAAAEIVEPANKYAQDKDKEAVDNMAKAGVTVIKATPEFNAELKKASEPVITKFEAKVAGSKEIIAKVREKFPQK
jgi:TRAP-type C4-dicarboxylate transport system substrate-binding protein